MHIYNNIYFFKKDSDNNIPFQNHIHHFETPAECIFFHNLHNPQKCILFFYYRLGLLLLLPKKKITLKLKTPFDILTMMYKIEFKGGKFLCFLPEDRSNAMHKSPKRKSLQMCIAIFSEDLFFQLYYYLLLSHYA